MRKPYGVRYVRSSERNGKVEFTVAGWTSFTKLTPTVHLDMIFWCHVVVCILDLHFRLEWPWLGRNGYVHITVPIGATFTKLAPTVHLDMIYCYHVVVCVLDLHFRLEWPWLGRNDYGYITVSRYVFNILQTYTNSSIDVTWWFVSLTCKYFTLVTMDMN